MADLHAQNFQNDPRIQQARQLILESLADHQDNMTAIQSPSPDLASNYQATLDTFGEIRGASLFYPYLGSGFGNGPLVELADGSVKYDMITGIGVHGAGHAHPMLVEASFNAAIGDTIMQGNLQQNIESVKLASRFVELATKNNAPLNHCFLTTSGVMANENALKMIFQNHHPASRIIAFSNCFAGRTMAVAAITDRPKYRDGVPHTLDVDYIPFYNHDDPKGSTARALLVLKTLLNRYPNQHAAMIFELVQGEGGYNVGHKNFFITLMSLLKEHNIAIMVDEVQTFGRTSQPFAFQHFGLDDYVDIVTIGKMTQVCATLFSDEFKPRPGLISQTFTGSTSAIFACNAILNELTTNNYFGDDGTIAKLHQAVTARLEKIATQHPGRVTGPYGIGGMIAFTPFDGTLEKTKPLLYALFEKGVIIFSTGGAPFRIRMLLPIMAISLEQIEQVMDIIETTLEEQA